MGLVNTLTAIACGADYVDATVLGMGRGAGNLNMELLLTYLNKEGLEVDFNVLSDVITAFQPLLERYKWGTNLPYMISGANSFPQKEVMEWVSNRAYHYLYGDNPHCSMAVLVDLDVFSQDDIYPILINEAERAATYHSGISTVKLYGSSVWDFIGTFFKKIFNGYRDYVNMVSGKITLATANVNFKTDYLTRFDLGHC